MVKKIAKIVKKWLTFGCRNDNIIELSLMRRL